jgi:two-component system response regulator PhoP
MRILIIEDEPQLRETLAKKLRDEGFAVEEAEDATDGQFQGEEYGIDVAIVDIGLGDASGIDVIRNWRKNDKDFPVLILTAHDRWQEKVEGLEAGADDYMIKPFRYEELIARVRALLRRASGYAHSKIACGPLEINLSEQRVYSSEKEVDLTAFEYKVLEYFLHHAGQVISKAELNEHLYEEEIDRDSNVLEVIIGRLRKKIDPEKEFDLIETLRGRGYRLNGTTKAIGDD